MYLVYRLGQNGKNYPLFLADTKVDAEHMLVKRINTITELARAGHYDRRHLFTQDVYIAEVDLHSAEALR